MRHRSTLREGGTLKAGRISVKSGDGFVQYPFAYSQRFFGAVMMHRKATGLAVISLLLCVVTVVLWVRSYLAVDIVRIGEVRLYKLASGGGGVFIERLMMFRRTGNWQTGLNPATRHLKIYKESGENYANFQKVQRKLFGTALQHGIYAKYPWVSRSVFQTKAWTNLQSTLWPRVIGVSECATATFSNDTYACEEHWAIGHAIWLPYWFLCIITAVSPAVWWLRKPARGQPGRCETCGYDLRATPNRCPECGNAPSKK